MITDQQAYILAKQQTITPAEMSELLSYYINKRKNVTVKVNTPEETVEDITETPINNLPRMVVQTLYQQELNKMLQLYQHASAWIIQNKENGRTT